MSAPRGRSLHPLLLDRSYWRNRLEILRLVRPAAVWIPRSDLSAHPLQVEEFRMRAHDGTELRGRRARCALFAESRLARVRVVAAGQEFGFDEESVLGGTVEFVLEVDGLRRLEDRVMDVLRVCEMAAGREKLPRDAVQLAKGPRGCEPDEFLIAARLLAFLP